MGEGKNGIEPHNAQNWSNSQDRYRTNRLSYGGDDQVLTFPVHIHDKEVAIVAAMSGEKDVVVSESGKSVHINIGPMSTIAFVIFLEYVDMD